VTFLMFLKVQI